MPSHKIKRKYSKFVSSIRTTYCRSYNFQTQNHMKKTIRIIHAIPLLISFFCCQMKAADFKFATITDTHISSNNMLAAEDLELSINSINNNSDIKFVFVSGDLTENGSRASLNEVKHLLDKLNVPYFAVPGNHETKWSESGATDFRKIFGNDRFKFKYNDFVFLGFNSGPIIRMMDGHVGIQDIIWLKNELDNLNEDDNIIIVTHYPMQAGDVDNWYEVTDLLRQYNVKAILGGHHHKNALTNYDGIPAIINRSNLRAKNDRGGYSIYTITEDSIIVSEQIIDQPTRKWGGYSLKEQYYGVDNTGYERPDYAVNQQYQKVTENWKVKNNGAIYSSPVLYEDRIYVGDDLGVLSCYSLKEGQLLWQFQSESRILGTPAVDKNIVVFGSADCGIYGVNAKNGDFIWKVETEEAVIGAVTIESGYAYIGGSDGHFRCINIKSGKLKWSYSEVNGYIETCPLIYDNKVIFGAWDSYLYALNKKNGKLAWKWNNGNARMHFSPAAVWPVGANGKVFFSAPDRALTALNTSNGEVIWRTKESMVRETIGLSEDKKRIYSKTMQDSVVCYSATGDVPEKIWATNVGYGYDHAPTMPIEKEGVVFGSTKNGIIFALNAFTGEVLWKHKIGNSLVNTILPLSANECIFTSADGYIGILKHENK